MRGKNTILLIPLGALFKFQINYGGKVPKSFYVKKREVIRCEEVYNTAVVKRGDKLKLSYACGEDKSFLK